MTNRRIVLAGIGGLAAVTLALAGCTTGSGPATNSPSTASPADALAAGLAQLKTQSYDLTLTEDALAGVGKGTVDWANKSATMDEKGTIQGAPVEIAGTVIAPNVWVKIDVGALNSQLGVDPTKWMSIDPTKLTGPDSQLFDATSADAFDVAGMLASTTSVTRTDATHLAGTVDLTAATGVSKPDADELTTAGAPAKTTPFTVTLDGQGRITEVKIDTSAFDKNLSWDIQLSNYGSPSPITKPADTDIIPAPDAVYSFMNQS